MCWFNSLFLCFLIASPIYADEALNLAAPSKLPGVTREMKSAGFWISRHPSPDRLIMNPIDIAAFNARTRGTGLTEDIAGFPLSFDGTKLKTEIVNIIDGLKGRKLYQQNMLLADDKFYNPLADNMGLMSIPTSVSVRFGFITRTTDERLLPTVFTLNAQPGDVDFDEVQNSGLEIGTVVAVLHATLDGRWFFVHEPFTSGWVEADEVALASQADIADYLKHKYMVVVIEPRTDIYLDSKMTEQFGTIKMGDRFFLKHIVEQSVEVFLPTRQGDGSVRMVSGFIDREDVSIGYLPYTARAVYRQSFKMLNAPYGWGDTDGEQDCSRFLQMVFATFGIDLPRNSGAQAKTGRSVAEFKETTPTDKKLNTILSSLRGITILGMKGHVALYLGDVNGRPYAIHATWAYREKVSGGKDRLRLLNRVIITDLDLGKGAEKKSLLERTLSVREIVPESGFEQTPHKVWNTLKFNSWVWKAIER